ncbi:hypothetical protein AX14_002224 [Amanita brunnescens Koide BX004]|nr:hypothetical protein AX14_002224 [Amanita brunnescens Koide BX004]
MAWALELVITYVGLCRSLPLTLKHIQVTDTPQILSGSSFAILDPLRSGGKMVGYETFKKDHHKHFDFFFDISTPSFPGTVIRLPLRSSKSDLSHHVVSAKKLGKMIRDYIADEMNISLLFLDNLRTIEVWEADGAKKTCLATWTKLEKMVERQRGESSLIYDSVLSNGAKNFSWRIVQTMNAEDEAKSRLSSLVDGETVNHIFEKHKLCPDVRIAYPLSSDEHISGRLFTFLPLPSKTHFPVHIHALFALTSSRQSLRNRNETGTVANSDNDVLIKWNNQLFDYYIPQAWGQLLKTLVEDPICKDLFDSWPPCHSSITSGDGLYWQNILQETLNAAVQSCLAIWPKVSEADTTTYVDLKSSLVVAVGQVDWDVLVALAQLDLTLVQLPKTHIELLDDSIIKLTPRVARDKIKFLSADFGGLTPTQRRILCGYLLSEKDFSTIYGFPLFPILNGSYASLEDRRTAARRYIALAKDEVDVFGASAGDAISLAEMQPEVAALVREKGTTQANVDLLFPPNVVIYLSSEPEPRSDERLFNLWSWLSSWHRRDEAIALLKAHPSLRLMPTSKGPQLVSSAVFRAPRDQLFEKLGLAFIGSLPLTVVHFLNNHGVVKDTGDMNDFLAAIDLAAMHPLSNDEAKSVFEHISICSRSLSGGNLAKLRKLPVFPVLVPLENMRPLVYSNTFVKWCTIDGLNVNGISPMSLIPLTDEINFLDKSSLSNPSCSVLRALRIPVLGDEHVLLPALSRFSSQPKSLRASFISYIREKHRFTNSVISILQKNQFIESSDGTLRSPMEVIDPFSELKKLFPRSSSRWFIPIMADDYDQKMLGDLASLGMLKASLTPDVVQERIAYISSNHTSNEALTIACSLLSLLNDPNFFCFGFSIDRSLRWLPTKDGLVSSKDCTDCGRPDADLWDEVLVTVNKGIPITPSFRALVQWDMPLPLDVITKQLDRVLGQPTSYRKVREIVKELAGRQLGDAEVKAIQEAIADRPWVPTESGTLTLPSRAVFVTVPGSSCFRQIGFSRAEMPICSFLERMGCHERPSVSAIISELGALREKPVTDITDVKQAVDLLEILPNSITPQEQASLLVPIDSGDLVPLRSGVCYYKGRIDGGETAIAHHLISEQLAYKIGLRPLGIDEAENDIDLGGKPITIIRNTLKQYDPKQFFTEFIANASDAGAKHFNIVLDNHKGKTERLLSEGLKVFQGASLVVHNDGIFTPEDFTGIRQTGIGGKRKRTGVIGHFGLGVLSMFHFTEARWDL